MITVFVFVGASFSRHEVYSLDQAQAIADRTRGLTGLRVIQRSAKRRTALRDIKDVPWKSRR